MTNIPNVYSQMDQWNSVMFLYDSALKAIRTKIEILNGEFVHIYGHTPVSYTHLDVYKRQVVIQAGKMIREALA